MTDDRDHEFSEGQGFSDPYDPFDIEPPELDVDPSEVDPVDSRVLTDLLDERTVGADAVDAGQLLDVGLSYVGINRHEQAVETFERAARFTEDPAIEQEAWTNKGVAHAELREWDAAIGAYREALAVGDEDPETVGPTSDEHAASARTNMAYALWESGRSEQALEQAERAVELDPRSPQAWYNRGFFLLERGLAEDAVEAFDNALRLGFHNAEILEEKARALEEAGEYERAEDVAEEASELREEAEQRMME
jgi:tetratricopeptide (TPR) repeat protein